MKFNPKSLKQLFSAIRKSPVDDMAVNAVKNNAGNLASGALDIVDDMPKSISLDDIAVDSWRKKQGLDDFSKSPITSSEFVNNYKSKMHDNFETRELLNTFPEHYANAPTELELALHPDDGMSVPMSNEQIADYVAMKGNLLEDYAYRGMVPEGTYYDPLLELYDAGYKFDSTPDYNAMDIRPERFGAIPSLKNSIEYPDGFTDPDAFARYLTALQQGYMSEGIQPYVKDFQRKPSYASFSLNKPKLDTVDLPEYTQNDFDKDMFDAFQNLRASGEDRQTTLRKFFKKYGYYPY